MRFVQERLIPALPSLRRWVGKGFWAVLDQALFAGSNFLVGVLLARWLEPAAYGAFSTAYSVFMLVGTLHTGLWTEPMLVFGSGRFREAFGGYQRVLIADHWRLLFLSTLGFAAAGGGFFFRGSSELALSFFGLAVATPLILYLWLVRRSAYVLLEPRLAASGGALYMALYLGCAGGLFWLGWLNEATAFLAMGGTALAAGGYIFSRVQKRLTGAAAPNPPPGQVRRLHWEYGRWALLAGALSWVPGNIYFVILPVFRSLEEVAVLKALTNLMMPVLHFNGALAGLFVPAFVRAIQQKKIRPTVILCGGILLVTSLIYMGILFVWGEKLILVLYGGNYRGYGVALTLLALWPLLSSGSNTLMAYLRASERPQWIALAYLFSALTALLIGVWTILQYGFWGAIISILLSMLCLFILVLFFSL